eukprot:SAG31_NODE_11821_length_995_cov_1.148438_2_plen_162_part_01
MFIIVDWGIFRECPKQRRRAKQSDRWANSGGTKGSRDLPYNSRRPIIRRRYGSVFSQGSKRHGLTAGCRLPQSTKRYYEYTLLRTQPDGSIVEDKSRTVFHILPGQGETDRGRRVRGVGLVEPLHTYEVPSPMCVNTGDENMAMIVGAPSTPWQKLTKGAED